MDEFAENSLNDNESSRKAETVCGQSLKTVLASDAVFDIRVANLPGSARTFSP
jgi:hypothetical protein